MFTNMVGKHKIVSLQLAHNCLVSQTSLIVPLSDTDATVLALIREHQIQVGKQNAKIMLFYPTARQTGLAAAILGQCANVGPVYEIHSRMSQSARIRVSNEYKNAGAAILCSSDVSARGIDFPGSDLILPMMQI